MWAFFTAWKSLGHDWLILRGTKCNVTMNRMRLTLGAISTFTTPTDNLSLLGWTTAGLSQTKFRTVCVPTVAPMMRTQGSLSIRQLGKGSRAQHSSLEC